MGAPKYTDEQRERAAELREQGKTYAEIEQETGVNKSAAHWICYSKGAFPPNAKARPPGVVGPATMKRGNHVVRRFTPEEDEKLIALEATGANISEIARQMGRKPNSIRGRLLTLGRRDELNERDKDLGTE